MMKTKPLINHGQLEIFHMDLKRTFGYMSHIDYTNTTLSYEGYVIDYRINRYDVDTNYNRSLNTLFIHPKHVKDDTLLMIHIKQAIKIRKLNLPWLKNPYRVQLKISDENDSPF